jgi:hypothetical protein
MTMDNFAITHLKLWKYIDVRNNYLYFIDAEFSSAWWYRRYRCGHNLRDRRKLFPPQDQIPSRTSTKAESVAMCWVCTPVPGSTKFKEWFTVRCWTPNCCWIPWYMHTIIPHFQSPALKGPPILLKKKLNYMLLCFIKLQFKPKCHGIDTIMYYQYCWYRKLQYSSSNNTGNTSIVKHTILEAPVFFYWSFQYRVFYNTSITSIAGWRILGLPVSYALQY